jgi:hypothetical protein
MLLPAFAIANETMAILTDAVAHHRMSLASMTDALSEKMRNVARYPMTKKKRFIQRPEMRRKSDLKNRFIKNARMRTPVLDSRKCAGNRI